MFCLNLIPSGNEVDSFNEKNSCLVSILYMTKEKQWAVILSFTLEALHASDSRMKKIPDDMNLE